MRVNSSLFLLFLTLCFPALTGCTGLFADLDRYDYDESSDTDTGPDVELTCEDGCAFDGECFTEAETHPENACQVCNGEDWGAVEVGESCGEHAVCADTQCVCEVGWTGPNCDQCIIFVNLGVEGGTGNGRSWENAISDLEAGIETAASRSSGVCQVWVAAGNYSLGDSPSSSFELWADLHIYGGFAGDETDPADRDLSDHNNATVLDGAGSNGPVVHSYGNAHLDGFVITNGYTSDDGGGLLVDHGKEVRLSNIIFSDNRANYGGALALDDFASVTGENIRFVENSATLEGGAIYLNQSAVVHLSDGSSFTKNEASYYGGAISMHEASLTTDNVTFTENQSGTDSGTSDKDGHGGAIYAVASTLHLDSTSFITNQAGVSVPSARGGALYITRLNELDDTSEGSTLDARNIIVQGNQSFNWGGGMSIRGSKALFVNLVVDRNHLTSSGGGGGIFYGYGSDLTLINATITRNGGAITHGGHALRGGLDSLLTVFNSIIWDNEDNELSAMHFDDGTDQDFFYSIVQGETATDTTFLEGPPEFVDLAEGDLRPAEGSLAIDKGDPDTDAAPYLSNDAGEAVDLDGNPRSVGDAIDLGAFEYQGE